MTMASGDAPVHHLEAQSSTSAPPRSGTGTTTRRRAKSFLRNYYGIQQADAANPDGSKENPSAQAGPVSKADPYDLGMGREVSSVGSVNDWNAYC